MTKRGLSSSAFFKKGGIRMTIIEAINQVDALKINTYSQADKIEWLSRVDGMIKKLIIDTHEGGDEVEFIGYNSETNLDTELLVPHPYDELYIRWLEAQIDYANAEYGKYNNSITTYNAAFVPLDGGRIVAALLPLKAACAYDFFLARWGMWIVIGLVATGAVKYILFPPVYFVVSLFSKFLM